MAIVYFLRNTRYHDGIIATSTTHPLFPFSNISHEIFDIIFCSSYYMICRFFNVYWLVASIICIFIILHLILLYSLSSLYSFLSHWFISTSTIYSNYLYFYFILMKDLLYFLFIILILCLLFYYWVDLWDFGNCDNNIIANPLSILKHIVPEWYFLLWFGFIKSFPIMILGLLFLLFIIFYLLLLGIRNLSSISYTITNIDYYYLSYAGLILYNWFRAYWTLGLSLLLSLLLFPLSALFITYYFISIQRLFIFIFIFILIIFKALFFYLILLVLFIIYFIIIQLMIS